MKQEFTINLNQRKYPVTIEDHSFEKLGETLKGLLAGKCLGVKISAARSSLISPKPTNACMASAREGSSSPIHGYDHTRRL